MMCSILFLLSDPRGIFGFVEAFNLPLVVAFVIPKVACEEELYALKELIKIIFKLLDKVWFKPLLATK